MKVKVRKCRKRPGKKIFKVTPLVGIEWEDKCLRLGDTEEQVRAVLGEPESGEDFFYFDSDLAIRFDENQTVAFIEFIGGIDGAIQPEIYGVRAFEEDADMVFGLLREKNGDAIDDSEADYCYAFLNTSVGVYRDSTPKDVADMILEIQKKGLDPATHENVKLEKKLAQHWSALGIGKQGFYCQ